MLQKRIDLVIFVPVNVIVMDIVISARNGQNYYLNAGSYMLGLINHLTRSANDGSHSILGNIVWAGAEYNDLTIFAGHHGQHWHNSFNCASWISVTAYTSFAIMDKVPRPRTMDDPTTDILVRRLWRFRLPRERRVKHAGTGATDDPGSSCRGLIQYEDVVLPV